MPGENPKATPMTDADAPSLGFMSGSDPAPTSAGEKRCHLQHLVSVQCILSLNQSLGLACPAVQVPCDGKKSC